MNAIRNIIVLSLFCGINFLPFSLLASRALTLYSLDNLPTVPVQIGGQLSPENAKAIKLSDQYKGKWVILDVSATWCPYCKLDQLFFDAQKNTLNEYSVNQKLWDADVVQVHLNVEDKAKGPRQQTWGVIRKFLEPKSIARDKNLKSVDRKLIDTYLLAGMDREAVKIAKTHLGELIFKNFKGYPYQMVFDPKGRLVFQGNFTSKTKADGDDWSKPYRRHYEMLSKVMANYK